MSLLCHTIQLHCSIFSFYAFFLFVSMLTYKLYVFTSVVVLFCFYVFFSLNCLPLPTPFLSPSTLFLSVIIFVIYRTKLNESVVTQFYITEAENEYVIKGNSAVMKCKIPSFVADYVQVEAWINAEDGTEMVYANGSTDAYGSDSCHSTDFTPINTILIWPRV